MTVGRRLGRVARRAHSGSDGSSLAEVALQCVAGRTCGRTVGQGIKTLLVLRSLGIEIGSNACRRSRALTSGVWQARVTSGALEGTHTEGRCRNDLGLVAILAGSVSRGQDIITLLGLGVEIDGNARWAKRALTSGSRQTRVVSRA